MQQYLIPGVYVIPQVLNAERIASLLQLHDLQANHDDGSHGHSEMGHGGTSIDVPDRKEKKKEKPKKKDKPGEKKEKRETQGFRASKPYALPWLSGFIWPHVPNITIGNRRPFHVDEWAQIYRLPEGSGVVPKHVDEDFWDCEAGIALMSILLYLNNDYEGGETVFLGATAAPHVDVGGGIIFRHDILHEGLPVRRGVKYVLKTDLFFR